VELFQLNEQVPWCRPYGIYTDKFDELLRLAQLGKLRIYTDTFDELLRLTQLGNLDSDKFDELLRDGFSYVNLDFDKSDEILIMAHLGEYRIYTDKFNEPLSLP
jgi:hypothetical protein